MTNKLVTAFIDDREKFRSLEEAVTHYDSYGYDVEGVRRNEGKDSNGLYVGNGFGFTEELAQVRTFTVEYTVTEEFAISLVEEQDSGDNEDGTESGPDEPESDSGLDEGVEPTTSTEVVVYEPGAGEPAPDEGGTDGSTVDRYPE